MDFWRTTSTTTTKPTVSPPLPGLLDEPDEHFIRAWTEDLYITGLVPGTARLSDILNSRQPLDIQQPKVHALRSAGWPTRPDGEVVIDPFDLEFVLGQRMQSDHPERLARRIHKVRYPVRIEGQNFEVVGTIHVFPGNDPEFAAHRSSRLFLPITEPTVRRERRLVSDPYTEVVLINRYSIRSIRQLDSPSGH